ncbi:MAG: GFA family protein [Dongiaceae bacterium]
MKVDGRCHCGFITYVAEVNPERVEICHCTDCQTFSGSAFLVVAPAEHGSFKLLSGELTAYVKTAESRAKRFLTFCPKCGTSIYSNDAEESPQGKPPFFGLRVGAMAQRDQLPPKAQYWVRSRQHWVRDLNALKEFEFEQE